MPARSKKAAAWPESGQYSLEDGSIQQLRQVAERWMDEVWRPGGLDTFNELHTNDFIDHSPAGRDPGRDGYRLGVAELYTAFPDFTATIDDLVIDPRSYQVAIRWTATGTHTGPFLGCQPTGRLIRFSGIEIISIEGNRIRERWGEWDGLSLMEQLCES